MDLLRGYPDADNPTTVSWCPGTIALYRQDLEYMPDLAFVSIRPARAAYEAAPQDFLTNLAHLRLLNSRLHAPAAVYGAATVGQQQACDDDDDAGLAVGVAGLQAKLQDAVEALQQQRLMRYFEKAVPAEQVRVDSGLLFTQSSCCVKSLL
jgi:hypothetical protein